MDYPLSQGPDGEQEILSFSYLTFHMNKQISMTIWIKKHMNMIPLKPKYPLQ